MGKTTTAVNLAAALAAGGKRVAFSISIRKHATTRLGIEPDGKSSSMYNVLVNSQPLAEVRRPGPTHVCGSQAHLDLAAAEVELAGVVSREVMLRDAAGKNDAFDYVLMDCAPSFGRSHAQRLHRSQRSLYPIAAAYKRTASANCSGNGLIHGGQADKPGSQSQRHRHLSL